MPQETKLTNHYSSMPLKALNSMRSLALLVIIMLSSTSALAEDWVNLTEYLARNSDLSFQAVLMDFDSVTPGETDNGYTFITVWKGKDGKADIKLEFQTKKAETLQYRARAEGEEWTDWYTAPEDSIADNMGTLAIIISTKGKEAAKDLLHSLKKDE